MDPCHVLRPHARPCFVITAYLPDKNGTMRPLIPDRCSPHRADDDLACELSAHHWRDRKTGPQFPVLIVKCRTHGVAFTLYPPGHVPHGRSAIAPVDLEGHPLRCAADGPSEPALAWEQTIVRAAQDAARGEAWPRSTDDWTDAPGSWRTQGRYVGKVAGILGLTGAGESPLVGPLGVSALGQREANAAYRDATGYQTRGRAVWLIVGELASMRCDLLDLILAAGFAAGSWGRPRRWDARTRQLRDVVPRARSP